MYAQKVSSGIRVAFIPNTEGAKVADKTNLNRLVWAATNALSSIEATSTVLKWLDRSPSERVIPSSVSDILSETELHMKLLRIYSQRVLQLKASQSAVVVNGRIIGGFNTDEVLTVEDFGLIERLSTHQHGSKIKQVLSKHDDEFEDRGDINAKIAGGDLIMKLIALLAPRDQSRNRFVIPKEVQDVHTVVKLPPKSTDLPYFDIFAVLDPGKQ